MWVEPVQRRPAPVLALWLPPLSATKEWTVPTLHDLAAQGFVAVSLDPWQHGQRGHESAERLRERVFSDFRNQMWPILGQTTLDCLRVLDWAAETLYTGPEVVAGGVSMGGDIAVALAGIDRRVARVATVVATPDWTRPGMHDLNDPARLLAQGTAGSYAQWFYDQLDPLTHPERYKQRPAISFECGADDIHISTDWARRFQSALINLDPQAQQRVRVTTHPGVGHLDAAQNPELQRRCLAWLSTREPLTGSS